MEREEPGEGEMNCDLGGRTSIVDGTRGSEGPTILQSEATRRAEEAAIGGGL